jgi:hypothetical protein
MRGGNWFYKANKANNHGSRHLLPSGNPRDNEYAKLEEAARENARMREERNRERRGAYHDRYREHKIATLRDLGLNERVSNIILNEADGFAMEYILNLNKAIGAYFNRGVQKNIREKYASRINRLSDSHLRSFLKATDAERNGYIRA